LPFAACSGVIPLAQDIKNAIDRMKKSDRKILLMVDGFNN
jgi:hypothetical protein